MGFLYIILIGAICGYIADVLMSDNGFGLIVNIIIGIAGSFVGRWFFRELDIFIGISPYWLKDIVVGATGAILILFVVGLLRGATSKKR